LPLIFQPSSETRNLVADLPKIKNKEGLGKFSFFGNKNAKNEPVLAVSSEREQDEDGPISPVKNRAKAGRIVPEMKRKSNEQVNK